MNIGGRVVVVGSANMDLVVRSPRFPNPGETLLGSGFSTFPGGKGANQAVACARMGGRTSFVGVVGDDAFGAELRACLTAAGVDTSRMAVADATRSGVALITIDQAGQNTIVVVAGANAALVPGAVHEAVAALKPSILVAQLEIPLEVVTEAASTSPDAFFILNPAPYRELPPELLTRVNLLTPNETELEQLTGIAPSDESSCRSAADVLLALGVDQIVITLGSRGCCLCDQSGIEFFEAPKVEVLDTTGAGDTFTGAVAAGLSHGLPLRETVRLAVSVASISTTRAGAQASMPGLAEVEALLSPGRVP